MGKKLFVGGLPYETTEEELRSTFEAHGSVESARIMTDRETGRSRGFAFVEMATEAEAQGAMRALDGSSLGGRTLAVKEARPRQPRTPSFAPYEGRDFRGNHDRADSRGGRGNRRPRRPERSRW